MKLLHLIAVSALALPVKAVAEYSTYGQRIVAAVLMGEARGEGEVGMTAIAEVIHNRAVEHGKTPLEVVCKKGAFSCLNGKTPEKLYWQHCRSPLFNTALRIAKTLYNNPEDLPEIACGATFYDHKAARPPWLSEVRLVTVIGQHAFYVSKRKAASTGSSQRHYKSVEAPTHASASAEDGRGCEGQARGTVSDGVALSA